MTFNETSGKSCHITPRNVNKNNGFSMKCPWNNLQGKAVANQNQKVGPITSYYIMHFALHVRFMDTVRTSA